MTGVPCDKEAVVRIVKLVTQDFPVDHGHDQRDGYITVNFTSRATMLQLDTK